MTAFDYQHIGTELARQAEKFREQRDLFTRAMNPLGVASLITADPFGYRAVLQGAAAFRLTPEELFEIEHHKVSLRGEARIRDREARQAVHIDRLRSCTTD